MLVVSKINQVPSIHLAGWLRFRVAAQAEAQHAWKTITLNID
jgi:hypothetical protein